jgi:uncharacterized protein (UPF0276 family)
MGPSTNPPAPGAGIGLRADHYTEFLTLRPPLALVEVHSENYFGGGRHLDTLLQVRSSHAISLHGVGLSLGSTDPLSSRHLTALKSLVDQSEPALVSDHLCWSSHRGIYTNDLLPLPCTTEALSHVARRLDQVQAALGRQILIENVSTYFTWRHADMSEAEFLATLVKRSGCGLLLDVNNLYVNARNHGLDVCAYLQTLPARAVQEIHLAGHVSNTVATPDGGSADLLIDTHSRPVCDAVWALYERVLRMIGPRPTIIEWDADLPPLQFLLQQAARAEWHLAAPCGAARAERCGAFVA